MCRTDWKEKTKVRETSEEIVQELRHLGREGTWLESRTRNGIFIRLFPYHFIVSLTLFKSHPRTSTCLPLLLCFSALRLSHPDILDTFLIHLFITCLLQLEHKLHVAKNSVSFRPCYIRSAEKSAWHRMFLMRCLFQMRNDVLNYLTIDIYLSICNLNTLRTTDMPGRGAWFSGHADMAQGTSRRIQTPIWEVPYLPSCPGMQGQGQGQGRGRLSEAGLLGDPRLGQDFCPGSPCSPAPWGLHMP